MVSGYRRTASFGFAKIKRFFRVDDDETRMVGELYRALERGYTHFRTTEEAALQVQFASKSSRKAKRNPSKHYSVFSNRTSNRTETSSRLLAICTGMHCVPFNLPLEQPLPNSSPFSAFAPGPFSPRHLLRGVCRDIFDRRRDDLELARRCCAPWRVLGADDSCWFVLGLLLLVFGRKCCRQANSRLCSQAGCLWGIQSGPVSLLNR